MTHDPLIQFRSAAERVMAQALGKLGVESGQIAFDDPPEGMGDLAFPCFALSKSLRRGPAQIAQELAAAGKTPEIASVKAAGPYVNFTFDDKLLTKATLEAVLRNGAAYGSHPRSGKRVLLEHTSANPTDRLHVGRGRNPIIGDTLARALRMSGCDVDTQYYLDDMGRQAAMRLMAERHGKTYQWAAGLVEAERQDPEAVERRAELDAIVKGAERGDTALIAELQAICKKVMEENISPVLRLISAEPDTYVSESKFVVDGSVGRAVDGLRASGKCGEDDGALFIDLAPFGVSGRTSRFFLTRGDGTSLYPARDVAYHVWKNGQCDRAINILGEDHKTESRGVEVALRALGQENVPDVLFYSFVSLPEGKMSARKGRVVYLDDLVEEAIDLAKEEVAKRRPELGEERRADIAKAVGVAAVRYNIVRTQPEKQMVFKWEEALNFEGNSAPFIQYAHARACSILAKAGNIPSNYNPSLLAHEMELRLVRRLAAFPSLIAKCARDMTPHLLASYAFLLASDFNQFYRDCPVLVAEGDARGARLALVQASRLALRSALNVLAIEPLEEM